MRLRKRRRTILKISMPFPLCTTLIYRRSTQSTLVHYLNYRLCFLQCLNKALNLSVSLPNHSVPFLDHLECLIIYCELQVTEKDKSWKWGEQWGPVDSPDFSDRN